MPQHFPASLKAARASGKSGLDHSGIGLSLVDRIAHAHDARITVEDGVGGRGFGCRVAFRATPDA